MHLVIFGAGAWGTALAIAAAPRHRVTLIPRTAGACAELASTRVNQHYLPGHRLPASVAVAQLEADLLAQADLIVIATPVAGLRAAATTLLALAGNTLEHRHPTPIIWVCKGCEEGSHLLPHQVVAEVAPKAATGVFAGPSFAVEVALGRPTALTVASHVPDVTERTAAAFHSERMRVYTSDDVVGVELGGAVKNVMAIATGISDGLGLGANTRAALVTRGLSEMMRLGAALGGRAETFMGLSGVGDLILTCTGELSRNRRVGIALGQGRALTDVLTGLGHVAEGTRAAQSVRALALAHAVDMPITAAVCGVLFEGLAPEDAVRQLLARAPKDEF